MKEETAPISSEADEGRRYFIEQIVRWGGLVVVVGGIGGGYWYNANIKQFTERAANLQEILDTKRKNRLVNYAGKVNDRFYEEGPDRLYVPDSIDGVAIRLRELPDQNGRLIKKEDIDRKDVLEAKLGLLYRFASTDITHDGHKLLITEREIIKQIIQEAVARAKSIGASTIVPTIDFSTQLTPNVPRGRPDYWGSKTTISGTISYYK